MKIVCLIKFVPDVEEFKYDSQRHSLIRDNVNQILNPDDACALAYALMIKRRNPETVIEAITMAPESVRGELENLVRRNIDQATLISDRWFAGSDTFATARILGTYLRTTTFDLVLTGTQSLDGDTSQVPSQIAEFCGLPQMSHVVAIESDSLLDRQPLVDVDLESCIATFSVSLPSVLSLHRDSGYKLPYVAFENLNRDVSAQLRVVTHAELGLKPEEVGLKGSSTRVRRSFLRAFAEKNRVVVKNDKEGIDAVYDYLKSRGFLA